MAHRLERFEDSRLKPVFYHAGNGSLLQNLHIRIISLKILSVQTQRGKGGRGEGRGRGNGLHLSRAYLQPQIVLNQVFAFLSSRSCCQHSDLALWLPAQRQRIWLHTLRHSNKIVTVGNEKATTSARVQICNTMI